MKPLYILLIIPFLMACEPTPMNEATAKSFDTCLKKDWTPDYFSNGAQVSFECNPPAFEMNEEARQIFEQCLAKQPPMNAIYHAKDGSVSCTESGASISFN